MKFNQKTIITLIVVGAVGYYLWDRNRKGKSLNPFKSFAGNEDTDFFNLTGGGKGTKKATTLYTAGGYDPLHKNPDGTRGATWIGYNRDRTQGYWQSGYVQSGTPLNPR